MNDTTPAAADPGRRRVLVAALVYGASAAAGKREKAITTARSYALGALGKRPPHAELEALLDASLADALGLDR